MFSNVNPQYPGLVGMLANSGSLDQAASQDIYDRAREPKQLVLLAEAGHGLTEAVEEVQGDGPEGGSKARSRERTSS